MIDFTQHTHTASVQIVRDFKLYITLLYFRDNPDILKSVQKLQRFSVPLFMQNKMKEFVRNVQGMISKEEDL